MYLGDNARAPYGSRSFDVVYKFTREAVQKLFSMGCHLVILACNTASAKALRTIQQHDLPQWDPTRRVLGIIRPTAESIGAITHTRHVGILATEGTIKSESYDLEIQKQFPDIKVSGVACPLWAAIVEANEADSPGADYFVNKRITQLMLKDPEIDTIILGCTLSAVVQQHPEVCTERREDCAAGRICGQQSESLSQPSSRNGGNDYEEGYGALFHHGEPRQIQGICPSVPSRTGRSGKRLFRLELSPNS